MPQKHFPSKKKSSKFAEFIQKKWEYYDQIFRSNSIFFAFWRNFAPKTPLLHLPNKGLRALGFSGKSLSKPGPPPTTRLDGLREGLGFIQGKDIVFIGSL